MAIIISFLSANNPNADAKSYVLPSDMPIRKRYKSKYENLSVIYKLEKSEAKSYVSHSNKHKRRKKYKARYTNEAPLYYLTKKVKGDLGNDEKIKYLFIVSKKVFKEDKPFKMVNNKFVPTTNGEKGEFSFFDYYKNFCEKHTESNCSVDSIPYDFIKDEKGEFKGIEESKAIANNIYQKIHPYIKNDEKVYIDYTGGLRDINYLLTTLMQYFEINNASCESIVYSQQNPYKIRRIKFIYKINTIIQGAHDFIATGDITKLKEFFNDKEKYPTINNLINKLDDFVKAVSIGQISELEDIKNKINADINEFEPKVTSDDEANLYRNIFTLLFPKIKGSLYIDGENNKFGYIEIVKWCIDHRFIQQAFTIYVEKFPEIYLDHGIKGLIDDSEVKPKIGSSFESTKFYINFWDSLLDKSELTVSPEKELGNKFKNFCCDYNTFKAKNNKDIEAHFENEVAVKIKELKDELAKYDNDKNSKILDLPKTQNKAKGFFNELCNNSEKLGYYLLGRGAEYETSKQNLNSQDASESYKKKKAVIDRLDSNKYKDLISVMQAYLCVKIIRNNMNHAAATDTEKDETLLLHEVSKKFLKDSEIALSDVFSYDVAKRIIDEGVKITARIVNKKIDLIKKDQYKELTGA